MGLPQAGAPGPALRPRRHGLGATALMAASGFAGLGWQLLWTQQSAPWLGHESAAVLAVLAAFFGGLALGAGALGARIARSARPARWYAACEALIAAWGLLLLALMPLWGATALALTGVQPAPAWHWAVAFGGSFVLLLPATAAMGATLPAMARVTAQLGAAADGPSIAALYAANTAGAVLGVLACAFWLLPELGLATTTGVCAALNAACAGAAWLGWRQAGSVGSAGSAGSPSSAGDASPHPASPAGTGMPPAAVSARPTQPATRRRLLGLLAATGLLGIGLEVAVVRVLSQVAENTVYTFALLLAVYLVGSALGAAAWARWGAPRPDAHALGNRLLLALAAACLLGGGSLWAAEPWQAAALAALNAALGPGLLPALATEAWLALAAFGPPTLVMGALFSQLAARAQASGLGLGQALAANTLGAALAPAVVGVLLLPAVGAKATLLLLAAGYLLLASPQAWLRPGPWLVATPAALLALAAPPLVFVDRPAGSQLLDYREGVLAAVSVVQDAQGVARLRINNRQQEGSSSSLQVDGRQALLPLLLHPAPRQVLMLGLGTGLTASAALQDPALQVEVVELLPEVIAAARHFHPAWADPRTAGRLQPLAADARRHVLATPRRHDVIVADNYHPARSGSAALYTVEHFRAVRARLAAGGLFCQWLPLHQMDHETLRSIVAAFRAVYPGGSALLASLSLRTPVLGLVGHADDAARLDVARLRARLQGAAGLPRPPAAFGLHDEWALLGSFVAGPQALARLAGDAVPNTDDRPVVAWRAPRITYAPVSTPEARLLALLPQLGLAASELLTPADASALGPRLAAYQAARNRYVAAGQAVQPSADVRLMLAQVQAPLLDALRLSPDFRPAYEPLLGMAQALARHDPEAARRLLTELARLQPARVEAGLALRAL
ncbi:fused MFS/spermidine synthase [Aquabacterium sp. OR-4]|uniref:fused MFS/spermidine synthase n=1 Tax=Aquabacterium sp. OR-4 TaxID=2978127 RepID=UPI0028C59A81|nr:fused MFS/spermidine synthase [Aquabacterium sp. OR-4]MDT7838922.1 fused MFS/spermidine synthase [Aquabacterium sp. OR-4]